MLWGRVTRVRGSVPIQTRLTARPAMTAMPGPVERRVPMVPAAAAAAAPVLANPIPHPVPMTGSFARMIYAFYKSALIRTSPMSPPAMTVMSVPIPTAATAAVDAPERHIPALPATSARTIPAPATGAAGVLIRT